MKTCDTCRRVRAVLPASLRSRLEQVERRRLARKQTKRLFKRRAPT